MAGGAGRERTALTVDFGGHLCPSLESRIQCRGTSRSKDRLLTLVSLNRIVDGPVDTIAFNLSLSLDSMRPRLTYRAYGGWPGVDRSDDLDKLPPNVVSQ